jgi:nucleotide-binding universal stress UspA family protein
MKPVLVAIDFSPVSHAVLRVATDLARAIHGRIFLLNVVQPPSIATDLGPLVGEVLQFTAEIERGARRHLHQIQKRLAARNVTVDTICLQGFPVAQIIARAKELEAEYIVLGSHGHTAFYDLVAGSTASGVLKRAKRPVVVVPAVPTKSKRRKTLRNNHRLQRAMLAPRL